MATVAQNLIATGKGLAVLIAFLWLGEGIANYTGAPIPGGVLGMLLLFTVLRLYPGTTPGWLVDTAHRLIALLPLFFIPAGVGIFFLPDGFADQWPALLGAIILGTLLSITLTGLVLKALATKAAPTLDRPGGTIDGR